MWSGDKKKDMYVIFLMLWMVAGSSNKNNLICVNKGKSINTVVTMMSSYRWIVLVLN